VVVKLKIWQNLIEIEPTISWFHGS